MPSGTFRFAFFTCFDTGIAYSAPIKSQKATAVIAATSLKSALRTYCCCIFTPVPIPIIPMKPIATSEPTSRNATISCIFANISTPLRFANRIITVIMTVYAKLGMPGPITSASEKENIEASTPHDIVLQIK